MLHALATFATFDSAHFVALLWAAIFGIVGILLIVAGYKIFDWMSPIDVEKELAERHNIAVAIVMAAVIIGVAIVIHASIQG